MRDYLTDTYVADVVSPNHVSIAVEGAAPDYTVAKPNNPLKKLRLQRVTSQSLRSDVYALRYRAYRKQKAIEPNIAGEFEDEFDHQPNHILWAISNDQGVVASMRTMWVSPWGDGFSTPELMAFSDDIRSRIPRGKGLLSNSRLVVEPTLSTVGAPLIMPLLRAYMGLAIGFTGWALGASRPRHLRFYKRLLRLEAISPARHFPGLSCKMHLMGCDLQQNLAEVLADTPVLQPQASDLMLLERDCENSWEAGSSVEMQYES